MDFKNLVQTWKCLIIGMEVATTERINKIMAHQTTEGEIRNTMISKANATAEVIVEVDFLTPRTAETGMKMKGTVLAVPIVKEMIEEEIFLPITLETRMTPSVLLVVLVPTAKWCVTINYFTIR